MAAVFYFPLPGTPTGLNYELSFFEAGLDVPLDVWTDSDLTIPWAQPIVFNAAGNPDGPIYVSSSPDMKVVYERPITGTDGTPDPSVLEAVPGYPVDFVTPSTIPGVMTTSITTLTNAQIKALPTTPITLVTAPASGLRVRVFSVSLHANTAAGAYTNINATYAALAVYYLGTFGQWAAVGVVDDVTFTGANKLTGLLGSANNQITDLPPYVDTPSDGAVNVLWTLANVQTVTAMNGIALAIAIDNNGSGALTGGNAANTLTVTVYYALESV